MTTNRFEGTRQNPAYSRHPGGEPRSRVLEIFIDGWILADGEIPRPTLGEVITLCLIFVPNSKSSELNAVIRAYASPKNIHENYSGAVSQDQPTWTSLLRGDGWSATCTSTLPLIDYVEMIGTLAVDYAATADPVRGRVTRIQLVTASSRPTDGERRRWETIPGSEIFTDISKSPRSLDQNHVDLGMQQRRVQTGILISLDIDDVPPPELRPDIYPASLGTHGVDLWVLDRELPVLLYVKRSRRRLEIVEHILPIPLVERTAYRKLLPDGNGCWITCGSGVYRLDSTHKREGAFAQIDDSHVWHSAALNGTLLTVTYTGSRQQSSGFSLGSLPPASQGQQVLRLVTRRGEESRLIDLPAGIVESVVATPSAFVLLLRIEMAGTSTFNLVSCTVDGDVRVGPALQLPVKHNTPILIMTDNLLIVVGRAIYKVDNHLALDYLSSTPEIRAMNRGVAGGLVWFVTPREKDKGRDRWWQHVDMSHREKSGTDAKFLFVVLHNDLSTPKLVVPCHTSEPSVAVTSDGNIWWVDRSVRFVDVLGNEHELDLSAFRSMPSEIFTRSRLSYRHINHG